MKTRSNAVNEKAPKLREIPEVTQIKVINVGSDTFGNPIFQKGLQN